MSHIAVINTGINNLKSIVGAINYLGYKTIVTNDKEKIMNSAALIVPGVGSYPAGMKKLKKAGLDIIIKEYFKKGKPILAICLGFQMLFKSSDEFKITKGLSFLSGQVRSLKSLKTKEIIPNLGWRKINFTNNKKNFLFQKISPKPKLYFIHSYCVETTNKKYITSTTEFGRKKIVSSIQYKNLYGVQFHPEKSGYGGLQIIKNFLKKSKKFNEDKIQLTKKG